MGSCGNCGPDAEPEDVVPSVWVETSGCETETETEIETDTHRQRQTQRQTHRHAHRQTGRQTNRHRQTQTDRDRQRQTETDNVREEMTQFVIWTLEWTHDFGQVIGGDKGGGKARPIAFEEVLLKLVTSSILRAHVSQDRRAAGSYQYGIYHEGGDLEIAWKIHAEMAAEPAKAYITCDIKKTGLERQEGDMLLKEPNCGARSWERSLPTCGLGKKKCNERRWQIRREEADRSESEAVS